MSLMTVSAILPMNSCARLSRSAISLARSFSCCSSIRLYASCAFMSSSLSLSWSICCIFFCISFSVSIFCRYSFSCLFLSCTCILSSFISSCSLLTTSFSCSNSCFSARRFLIFSSCSCWSRDLFSFCTLRSFSCSRSFSFSSSKVRCFFWRFSYSLSSIFSRFLRLLFLSDLPVELFLDQALALLLSKRGLLLLFVVQHDVEVLDGLPLVLLVHVR
mmetsp:Transcript_14711/g.17022  ORF Transcript_14711/g.17022 Transcript_14711/m.17022 type:complete len:217 (-) Transcript_14711:533-1183(-)